jgi:phage shock protein PspC (stress-responsive transcriptional regulator)
MRLLENIKHLLDIQFFGVCTSLGKRLGVSVSAIRVFFIYTSFLVIGSPVAIYLGLAFLKNIKKHYRDRKRLYFYDI